MTRSTVAAVAAAAASFVAAPWILSLGAAPELPPHQPKPIIWEYRTASLREDLQGTRVPVEGKDRYASIDESLDRLGLEGWELAHAAGDFFVFKRPRVER